MTPIVINCQCVCVRVCVLASCHINALDIKLRLTSKLWEAARRAFHAVWLRLFVYRAAGTQQRAH